MVLHLKVKLKEGCANMGRTLISDLKSLLDDERASETPEAKAEQRDRIKRNMDIAGATLAGRPKATPGNIGSRVDFSDEKIGPKFKDKPVKKITREKTTVEGDIGSVDRNNPDVIGPNMGQVNTPDAPSATQDMDPMEQARKSMGFKRGGKIKKACGGGKMASGGKVTRSKASHRADGCCVKGHTKGKYL